MEPALKLKWKDVTLVSTRKAGEGSYGIVYECFEEGSPKKKYAVKCIQLRGGSPFATQPRRAPLPARNMRYLVL